MSSIWRDDSRKWWLGRHPITRITAEYLREREAFDQAMDEAIPAIPLERTEIVYEGER